jgi:predicted RNA binding protein YcfA (HicA-like mRNA interferase family)
VLICLLLGSENQDWKAMKVRDIIKLLEDDGWYLVVTKGSHRQYKHQTKKGRVTIAGHNTDDLAPGTLNSILKQAQLKEKRKHV